MRGPAATQALSSTRCLGDTQVVSQNFIVEYQAHFEVIVASYHAVLTGVNVPDTAPRRLVLVQDDPSQYLLSLLPAFLCPTCSRIIVVVIVHSHALRLSILCLPGRSRRTI